MFLLQRASEKSLIIKRIEIKAPRFGGDFGIFNPRKNIGIVDISISAMPILLYKENPRHSRGFKKSFGVPYENKTPLEIMKVRSGNCIKIKRRSYKINDNNNLAYDVKLHDCEEAVIIF